MTSKGYVIKCRNDIIAIPDVVTGLRYVKSWGMNIKGLKAKDEIIKVLLSKWDEKNEEKGPDSPLPVDPILTTTENRKLLLEKYDEVLKFYGTLNEGLQKDINSVFKNFKAELEYRQHELMSPDCYILVAGDRVSGKSSFINQLLRRDILPTQQLACTATICEIRYNLKDETKCAHLHKKGDSKHTRLDLSEDEKVNFRRLKECIMELDDDDESPYDKIEILWPFDILKGGIVLVDTPGIGESRSVVKRLHDYMTQSFGFIYIIDSAQASGLQRGRLQDFLRTVVNSTDDILDPRATLFACNKWDVVPPKEQDEIRALTMMKLKRIFPDVRDEQVFTVSTLLAAKSAAFGSTHPDFKFLMANGIKKLIQASMKNKTISNYRWLWLVLRRACYSLKVAQTIGAQSVKTNSEMVEQLKVQLDKLQNEADTVLKSAKIVVEEQINLLHKEMADLLRSRGARDKICTWELKDCPKQADYKKVTHEASEKIAERIMKVIDAWEKEKQFVKELHETIMKKFEEECQLMENQLQEVSGVLRISCPVQPSDLRHSMKFVWASTAEKNVSNTTNSITGLGSAVSCAGVLSTTDRKVKELFKKYKKDKDPEDKMMQASVYYMESIFVGHRLRESLSKFLKRFIKGIDSVAEKIPDFIRADNELLVKTKHDLNESGTLQTVYPAMLKKANELQGQLDLFYVTKCMTSDYSLNDLKWNRTNLLGVGSFADVYKAKLNVGEEKVNVALKITNDQNSVKESTVTDIIREENTLRGLDHENIVKYYGSVLFETETNAKKKLKWIMILEYCNDTLKNKFIDSEYQNPGRVPREQRMSQIKIMAEYVIQLCNGLQYLHDKHLVHRDLKLENVLLTHQGGKDTVKLTDVGLTKSEDFISGTFAGSPVYMAPEVILRQGIYDRKADIYSLAIILWEIWYGQDAAVYIGEVLRDQSITLEKAIEVKKLRPSLVLESCPSLELEDIIEKCWHDEPKKRLDARDIGNFFQSYF